MAGTMTERLQLVVDATTQGAEVRFDKLTTAARETGDASVRSAADVATAADKVLAAQARQADAAGQLRVAQQKLLDLQDKGKASAAQLAAAEERVEGAQRKLHLATRDVTNSQEAQERATRQATDAVKDQEVATERSGRAHERLRDQVGQVGAMVTGLVAGDRLVDWLGDSLRGFTEGARGANALATSMNASIAQAGQLGQLMASVGLEADDLLEIQAEFAQKSADGLNLLGDELKTNRDGTVNWALSLEDALAQLQQIPDATERNRQGFAMFGEEGYKQLSRLLNSGMSVADALDTIGTPFSDEDVAAVQDYDQAMLDLKLTGGNLGRTLGREVIPMVADVAGALGQVVGVVTSIPAPLGIATAAAIAYGQFGLGPLAKLGGGVSTAMDGMRTAMDNYRVAQAVAGREGPAMLGLVQGAAGAAKGAVGGLVSALGGPLGVGLITMGAAVSIAKAQQDDFNDAVTDGAKELAKAEQQYGTMAVSARELGQRLADERSAWDNLAAAREGAKSQAEDSGGFWGFLDDMPGFQNSLANYNTVMGDGELAARGYAEGISKAKDELGATATQQEVAQVAQRSLTDLIAEGTTSGADFAARVRESADAQRDQTATTDTAAAAIAAYDAVTRGASEAVLGLLSAQLAAQDADYGYLSALDTLNAARDDEKTLVDEVAQAHTAYKEAALNAAGAAADAAVAAATAAGQVITPLDEANIRADTLLTNLREKLNTPGLSDGAKADLSALTEQLQAAKDKGDVQALITLTGVDEAEAQLQGTTEDRTATITAESRGGPAVISYLDGIASQQRLAIVNVESRGGPAVDTYVDGLATERLAIIRVESRNGPAVGTYVDGLTSERLAIIRVETRNGPAVDEYLDNLASNNGAGRTAVITVQRNGAGAPGSPTGAPAAYGAPAVAGGLYGAGSVSIGQLTVQVASDGAGNLTQRSLAEAGRQYVAAIGAYEQRNGTGWRGFRP